jgi:hypothetical protein
MERYNLNRGIVWYHGDMTSWWHRWQPSRVYVDLFPEDGSTVDGDDDFGNVCMRHFLRADERSCFCLLGVSGYVIFPDPH